MFRIAVYAEDEMTLEQQCTLSFYKEVAGLGEKHNVAIVQNQETGQICVKKELAVFDISVYMYLKECHIENTPWIYEVIENNGTLIVIEEYISGKSLREILNENGKISPDAALEYVRQLCGILSDLHNGRKKIIHRDIKPENIIITTDRILKLLDMNAARQFNGERKKDTVLMGTAGYAAPEQYGFGASDERTDIYATGVLLNELLTGNNDMSVVPAGWMGEIIRKATRMNPEERYGSAEELLNDLNKRNADKSRKKESCRWYIPAGFRSGKPWQMVLAAVGYAFLLIVALTLNVDKAGPAELWINRIAFFLLFYLVINAIAFWIFEGRKISDNKILRILLAAGTCAVIFLLIFGCMYVVLSLI